MQGGPRNGEESLFRRRREKKDSIGDRIKKREGSSKDTSFSSARPKLAMSKGYGKRKEHRVKAWAEESLPETCRRRGEPIVEKRRKSDSNGSQLLDINEEANRDHRPGALLKVESNDLKGSQRNQIWLPEEVENIKITLQSM